MVSLKGSIVCITGASSGIGAACAGIFAGAGASLLLLARRKDRLGKLREKLTSEYGVQVHTLCLDVRDRGAVEQAFSSLDPEWRTIRILLNNAGLSRGLSKFHEGSVQDWEEMIDVNIKGLLAVSRAVIPWMVARDSGHVINVGSIAGRRMGYASRNASHRMPGSSLGLISGSHALRCPSSTFLGSSRRLSRPK